MGTCCRLLHGSGYQLKKEDCSEEARWHYIFGRHFNADVLVVVPSWAISEYMFLGRIPELDYLGCVEMEEESKGSDYLDARIEIDDLSAMFPEDHVMALTAVHHKRKLSDEDEKRKRKEKRQKIKNLKKGYIDDMTKEPERIPSKQQIIAQWDREDRMKAKKEEEKQKEAEKEAARLEKKAARAAKRIEMTKQMAAEAKVAEAAALAAREAENISQKVAREERAARKALF